MQSLINDRYVIIGGGTRITAAELSEVAYCVCMSPLQLLESMESFVEFVTVSIGCIRECLIEPPRSRFVVPKCITPTIAPLITLRRIRPCARSTC